MPSLLNGNSKKAGQSPGSLVHVGERKVDHTRVYVTGYNSEGISHSSLANIDEVPFVANPGVLWVNIDGLHDIQLIEKVGEIYGISSLTLEDVLNTLQRPKCEDLCEHIYITLKSISMDPSQNEVNVEQVSIFFGQSSVLTFQEKEGDVFRPISERLNNPKARLRRMGADYLAYELLDLVVDNYFVVLEAFGEKLEELEDHLVTDPDRETMHRINQLKRELLFIRKVIWPLREVIGVLERTDSSLISQEIKPYLKDIYDHIIQVIETVEIYREMLSGMLDIYLSSISNKTNEVMKVLTIIATIFIPLTFIVGIYGMNFKYMPELESPYAYPAVWIVMVISVVLMLKYFRRRKWF